MGKGIVNRKERGLFLCKNKGFCSKWGLGEGAGMGKA